ncbi:MAG: hypothetical protein GWP66_10485 [Gammaproteobacteria bacterium]|nr:hypothetical protein [Gammaproteobacteria bacterium]
MTDTPASRYLHADHAGNFADLYKHARLIALLRALGALGALGAEMDLAYRNTRAENPLRA